ncbi:MAG: CBS domain-containing protein [Candidatus Bathyarchaeota archaeon]|nr:CBS domain-containing protein [Candidatus Bathyarchaeota archaeon]
MGLKDSVETVMRSPPVIALFSDSVSSVIEKMITNNIGAVIIMSGGNPIGIITERDIIEKVTKSNRDPSKIRAEEIMSSPLISIEVDKTVKEALTLMRNKKIRRLGVTRKGKLIGIITERRVLEALASL